jgi:release factor glutamine methyltransferase
MNTYTEIRQHWQQSLEGLYPSREISSLFRFVLEDVLSLPPAEQKREMETLQSDERVAELDAILQRLLTGEPLQHITGFTFFDDLKIDVSPAVLIPRPETEELVRWISESLPKEFTGNITDWCTGSGCIALALKNRFPQAHICGYDWSEAALEVAEKNAAQLQLSVCFERRDALSEETSAEKADVLVSNPPYIPETMQADMHVNVREFEPHMALFVPDDDALLFYDALTKRAIAELNPGGMLFFELHEDYASSTKEMVEKTGAFASVEIRKDIYEKERMLKAVLK